MATVPVVQTPRLLLRELRAADFDAYAQSCGDAEAMRYIGTGQTLAPHEAWRSLAFFIGHWELRGFGMWAVVNRSSGRFIGRVGFHQPHDWPGFEIGWFIERPSWRQGFATEAARALLPLAHSAYGQSRVISLIHPENTASIRVAEKIGESFAGETQLREMRVLIYAAQLHD